MGLSFLTETCTHKNNPSGASLVTVATGIACSPIDALLGRDYIQDYPTEKLFLKRQTFTEYTAFVAGDLLVADSITYAVMAVHSYDAQGGMSAYTHLILELQSGS